MSESLFFEIILAFLGGLITFITPCIYPTILGYFSFLAGAAIQNLEKSNSDKFLKVFFPPLLFPLGLSVVFTLNAFPGPIQELLIRNYDLFAKVAGGIIIFFGLAFLGLVNIFPLYQGKKFQLREAFFGLVGILLLGAAFGMAWTHCLGPILSSILSVANIPETASRGLFLLSIYSLGLGVSFVLTGILFSWFLTIFNRLKLYYGLISALSGGFLILIGVSLIFTPWWTYLSKVFIGLSSNSLGWRLEALLLEFFKK